MGRRNLNFKYTTFDDLLEHPVNLFFHSLYHASQQIKRKFLANRRKLTDLEKTFLKDQNINLNINQFLEDFKWTNQQGYKFLDGKGENLRDYAIPDVVRASSCQDELFLRNLEFLKTIAEGIPYTSDSGKIDYQSPEKYTHSHPFWSDIDFKKLVVTANNIQKKHGSFRLRAEPKVQYIMEEIHLSGEPLTARPDGCFLGQPLRATNSHRVESTETIYRLKIEPTP
jgi:hypothetical protein